MNRRQFLKKGVWLAAGSLGLPAYVHNAHAYDFSRGEHSLYLYRPQSKETINLVFMKDGKWEPGAYDKICWFLRDVKAGKHVQMDTELIALLAWVQRYLRDFGYHSPIHILSGYRSPETNDSLENASKNSMHLYGKAVDMRIPGLSHTYLDKLFKALGIGGVGDYAKYNSVHIDTGPVRTWKG